jgi:hypothetical protein
MKKHHLSILLGFASTLASQAASLLVSAPPGWNGIFIEMNVRSGFVQAGMPGGLESATTATKFLPLTPYGYSGGEHIIDFATNTASPGAGDPKDKAAGTLTFHYFVGAGGVADQFSFDIDTTTSATTAHVDFGLGGGLEKVDAFVEMDLYLRTFGPLSGAMLTLPGLPTLTGAAPTTESMIVTFFGPPDGFMLPGIAAIDYPLDLSPIGDFEYHLNYKVLTPYGTDPQIIYNITGGGAALVPEPGSLLLLAFSSMAFLRRKRGCCVAG